MPDPQEKLLRAWLVLSHDNTIFICIASFHALWERRQIRPFSGNMQPLGVMAAVNFVTQNVTFVEIACDDIVLNAHPIRAKAKILL